MRSRRPEALEEHQRNGQKDQQKYGKNDDRREQSEDRENHEERESDGETSHADGIADLHLGRSGRVDEVSGE